ncbi:MAG: cation:proton antiporter [Clostridiales bacterium]|nr:cation:proton antiporter [Clostridiales bacterium]
MVNSLLGIAIALILGLLVTRLMKLIGLPNVTGYLIVGLIIGPYGLGKLVGINLFDGLKIISTVALGFIGFSIGVEFKLSHIKEIGKSAITITFCQALAATLCVDIALLVIHWIAPSVMSASEAIIMGAIATATAPAATLMVVRQYKAKGVVTGTLLPVVALDDAVGLIVFAISSSIAFSMASGAKLDALSIVVWPLLEIICSLVIGAAIGALLSVVPRFFKSRDNRTIATIIAVALSLGVCQLFEYMQDEGILPFALSDLLVCMMAGATFVNLRKEAPQMMEGTDRWTPVVLMLFFILSGAELDVMMFFEKPIIIVCILVYIVFRCVGKYFGTMLGATVTKSDKNVRNYLGITLFPQAGVAIGMATMCAKKFTGDLQEVGQSIVTITMCAVLIYELVGPVLTKWALGRAGEIAPENLGGKRRKKAVAEGVSAETVEALPETTTEEISEVNVEASDTSSENKE